MKDHITPPDWLQLCQVQQESLPHKKLQLIFPEWILLALEREACEQGILREQLIMKLLNEHFSVKQEFKSNFPRYKTRFWNV